MDTLCAEIVTAPALCASLETEDLTAELGPLQITAGGDFSYYDGTYSVRPKMYEEITLATKSKAMRDDVSISKIPRYEVGNDFGGITLIMGDEYYNG